VICDDIYNQINFSSDSRSPSILDVADDNFKKQIVIVHGASKSYAMTGWRMGWIAGPLDLIQKLTQFYSQTLTCTPDFIQKATETALTTGDESVQKLKKSMIERHEYVLQGLSSVKNIKVYPSAGAFYIWIELLNKTVSSMDVIDQLLKQHGIAGVPGEAFGMPFHFRLAVTLPKPDLQKLIERLKLFFTERS
jgi:aspartate/methionine/tyrosine aminotransferase